MAAAAAAVPIGLDIAAKESAGVLRAVLNALEKPVYTNQEVTSVTHRAKNGDIVVRTRTKGWTIPLGLILVPVGIIALWEIGMAWKNGVQAVGNLLNPSAWVEFELSIFGIKPQQGQPSTVKLPPSFMAQLSLLGQQVLQPGSSALSMVTTRFNALLKEQGITVQ